MIPYKVGNFDSLAVAMPFHVMDARFFILILVFTNSIVYRIYLVVFVLSRLIGIYARDMNDSLSIGV